jgi:hypothetical protein
MSQAPQTTTVVTAWGTRAAGHAQVWEWFARGLYDAWQGETRGT